LKLEGPYTYQVSVDGDDSYSVLSAEGRRTFLAPVTTRGPKLYVFSHSSSLIYIGQTVQGMSARMRLGFKADGTGGYWGYRWRKELAEASLHIWVLNECPEEEEFYALECIESEVVYLYRSEFNQWPKFQTEIHFHESEGNHRALAREIFNGFNKEAINKAMHATSA